MTAHSFANPFRPYNPFIASVEEPIELDEVEEIGAHVSYALVQSGPAIAADEVESHLDAVEVKVTWGTQVLSVNHLESGKGFSIGEGGDFVVPNATLKTDIVGVRNGAWFVSVPMNATATVEMRGQGSQPIHAGNEIDVREGMRVSMDIDGVTIEISAVRAGKKFKVGFLTSLATGAAAAIGLSFLGHTAIVASMALFMPSMNPDDAESISREQVLKMQALLDSSADREQDRLKDEAAQAAEAGGGSTGGEPTKGEAGTAGTAVPLKAAGHMAFKGRDEKSAFSRQEELNQIQTEGMVGMLRSAHSELGHTAPWGDTAMGTESQNAYGAFFGQDIGEVSGSGYALSGTGEGGGGKGEGVGIDGVGNTVGGGGGGKGKWGFGPGDGDGLGRGHGPLKGGHVAKAPPPLREGIVSANGHLPAEVIQRIVRQNFGRFRLCYEAGLRGNPTLQGRVVTKFVIGRDGAVSQSADGGSDLPDQAVTSCVVRSFQNLSFPTPESGIVTVSYPISFQPGQ